MKKFLQSTILFSMLACPFYAQAGECDILEMLTGIRKFVCEHSTGNLYYSNGTYAGTRGGNWFHKNSKFAGKAGENWFYDNGAFAGSEGGNWYHKNSKYAGKDAGNWFYDNGVYAGNSTGGNWYYKNSTFMGALASMSEMEALQFVLNPIE